jgi:hypothetical protein
MIPKPTGNRIADLLAERRAIIEEQRHEPDPTARVLLEQDTKRIDDLLSEVRRARL